MSRKTLNEREKDKRERIKATGWESKLRGNWELSVTVVLKSGDAQTCVLSPKLCNLDQDGFLKV